MNIIIVDDEQMAVDDLLDSVSEILPDANINCFTSQQKAIDFIKEAPCDVARKDRDGIFCGYKDDKSKGEYNFRNRLF